MTPPPTRGTPHLRGVAGVMRIMRSPSHRCSASHTLTHTYTKIHTRRVSTTPRYSRSDLQFWLWLRASLQSFATRWSLTRHHDAYLWMKHIHFSSSQRTNCFHPFPSHFRVHNSVVPSSKRSSQLLGGWFMQVYLHISIYTNGYVQVHLHEPL